MLDILRQFFTYTDNTIPIQGYKLNYTGPEEDDEEDDINEPAASIEDLVGTILGIEYIDSKGQSSTRQVSITKAYHSHIQGYCYLRKKLRTFRIDRIKSVFDEDGIILDPQTFFKNCDINSNLKNTRDDNDIEDAPFKTTDKIIRAEWRDELRLLVALSRTDGKFHPNELDSIIQYVVAEAERVDIFPNDNDISNLSLYLKTQYPRPEIISRCLESIKLKTEKRRERFFKAATNVVNADRIQNPKEFDFLMKLKEAINL